MSRVYAIREDTSERILIEIVCDTCGTTLKPKTAESGWIKRGFGTPDWGGPTYYVVTDYCPDCA
jgi:hypothetical protein